MTALHFSVPFRYVQARMGGFEPAQEREGSTREIADCVELTIRTVAGTRQGLPSFGRPATLEFSLNPELAAAQVGDAVDRAEPRARAIMEGDFDPNDEGTMRIKAMWTLIEREGEVAT